MASVRDASGFDAPLGCLIEPDLGRLATQLAAVAGVSPVEGAALLLAVRDSLLQVMHTKLDRLLILELHAARTSGRLQAPSSEARWDEFLAQACMPSFWAEQARNYPTMPERIRRIIAGRCAAALEFAQALAADRPHLEAFHGTPLGALTQARIGAGDSHQQGRTVIVLQFEGGQLVYKPRSLRIDARLRELVQDLASRHPGGSSMRVPRVLERGAHGWAEFVRHDHAQGPDELRRFYEGIGHWLALMRLLSGSDLHAENLIAHRDAPVVVDCETLFTPSVPHPPSGLGQAADRAARLAAGTVLNIGLLPGRGQALGWRGVDSSALGSLPGHQPRLLLPAILQAGTDTAHVGHEWVEAPPAQNHPSAAPALADHWGEVLGGFDALTHTLQALDERGELAPRLRPFADCRVRVVVRATEAYAELGRMLWHPVSLHKEAEAQARAADLLCRMAGHNGLAPGDPEVVAAEVRELLDGDVPLFTTRVDDGRLQGPGGTHWLAPQDLAAQALARWRARDAALEQHVIRAALVSAYINDGWMPKETSLCVARPGRDHLDRRRREQAAGIMRQLLRTAIRGDDGTVTWIAPVLGPAGWSVQPLREDLYAGLSGVALLVAAYLREAEAGRADPLPDLHPLLPALLGALQRAEDTREAEQVRLQGRQRPPAAGGYIGLGSQIWTWLVLERLGAVGATAVERACALAEWVPAAAAADDLQDLLTGKAGVLVPLILLARRSGQSRPLELAVEVGDLLAAQARRENGQAWWPREQWPQGVGGFVHGASGMAWALRTLARAGAPARFSTLADEAQAFEDGLWCDTLQNWRDLRGLEGAPSAAAWCHGAVGIGLAALDLDPGLEDPALRERVRRAAEATWRQGLGWNHSLCHGDAGAHALLAAAADHALAPAGVDRESLLAGLVGSLEAHGPVCGIARDVFVPGLLPGLGGVAYELLRAHPQSRLPDVLMLSPGNG
jgi:type 2 lantibiotic biosynthesis protein LanM